MHSTGIALHEAGHAVAGDVVGLPLSHVEVHPDGGGVTVWRSETDEGTDARLSEDRGNSSTRVTTRATRIDSLRGDADRFEELLAYVRRTLGTEEGIAARRIMIRAGRLAHATVPFAQPSPPSFGSGGFRVFREFRGCAATGPSGLSLPARSLRPNPCVRSRIWPQGPEYREEKPLVGAVGAGEVERLTPTASAELPWAMHGNHVVKAVGALECSDEAHG